MQVIVSYVLTTSQITQLGFLFACGCCWELDMPEKGKDIVVKQTCVCYMVQMVSICKVRS